MPMLPEVVEMFGGKTFDVKTELMVSGVIATGCIVIFIYVQLFLDDDLRPKKEPLAFIPRAFGWTHYPIKARKKD